MKEYIRTSDGVKCFAPIHKKPKEVFIEQARKIWGDRYDYSESEYMHGKKPIVIYCPKHDYYFRVTMAQNHIMKERPGFKPTGCPVCAAEKLHGCEYGTDWRKYLKLCAKNNRVGKIGKRRHDLEETTRRKAERDRQREEAKVQRWQAYQARLQQQKEETRRRHEAERTARQQAREQQERQRIQDLQDRVRREGPLMQGDGYIYKGIEQVTSKRSTIMVHCPNPDHEWHLMRVDLILQGCKCRECAGRHQSVKQRCQEWIAKCIEKYGEGRYDYNRAHEDYVNNDSLVWIRCCIHDHWFQTTPDNNLRTVNGSCPICSAEFTETQGEAEIRRWLLKHDIINFQQDEITIQHDNPRCRRQYLRPDFWLPDYNLFIEYNGEQHYEDVDYFFDDDFTFEDQQIRDQTLRDYCRKNNIQLLEIPYTEFDNISEILAKTLLRPKAKDGSKPVFLTKKSLILFT